MEQAKIDRVVKLSEARKRLLEYDRMFLSLQKTEEDIIEKDSEQETRVDERGYKLSRRRASLKSVTFNYENYEGESRSQSVELTTEDWHRLMIYAHEWVTTNIKDIDKQLEEL